MKLYPPRPWFIYPSKYEQLWLIIPLCIGLCFVRRGGIIGSIIIIIIWVTYQTNDSEKWWKDICNRNIEYIYVSNGYAESHGYAKTVNGYIHINAADKVTTQQNIQEYKSPKLKVFENYLKTKALEEYMFRYKNWFIEDLSEEIYQDYLDRIGNKLIDYENDLDIHYQTTLLQRLEEKRKYEKIAYRFIYPKQTYILHDGKLMRTFRFQIDKNTNKMYYQEKITDGVYSTKRVELN